MNLRKFTTLLIGLTFLSHSLHADCGACARGEGILSGIAGPGGGVIVLDNFYNFNTIVGAAVTFGAGMPITFNGTPLVAGTGITQTGPGTFLITKTGHFLANFVGSTTALSLLGGVTYTLNGVPQGVTSPLATAGAPLVLNQILNVTTVPTTLQVISTGLGVTLAIGTSATLSVVLVNTP